MLSLKLKNKMTKRKNVVFQGKISPEEKDYMKLITNSTYIYYKTNNISTLNSIQESRRIYFIFTKGSSEVCKPFGKMLVVPYSICSVLFSNIVPVT